MIDAKRARKRRYHGWHKDQPDHRDRMMAAPFWRAWGLPARADCGTRLPRVEDQGTIGTCVWNSLTSAYEYLTIKLGKPVVEMSRLFGYYITRVWIEHIPEKEDSGCQIRDGVKVLSRWGVCHEATWPYDVEKFGERPSGDALREADQHKITQYWRCPSLRSLKVSLAQGYPVAGGFQVPESIESTATETTGVVSYPRPGEGFLGGHAVLFVGYDDALKLLKFENSWGREWGDKGFGFLPYSYVQDNLADDFWTVRAGTGV